MTVYARLYDQLIDMAPALCSAAAGDTFIATPAQRDDLTLHLVVLAAEGHMALVELAEERKPNEIRPWMRIRFSVREREAEALEVAWPTYSAIYSGQSNLPKARARLALTAHNALQVIQTFHPVFVPVPVAAVA